MSETESGTCNLPIGVRNSNTMIPFPRPLGQSSDLPFSILIFLFPSLALKVLLSCIISTKGFSPSLSLASFVHDPSSLKITIHLSRLAQVGKKIS